MAGILAVFRPDPSGDPEPPHLPVGSSRETRATWHAWLGWTSGEWAPTSYSKYSLTLRPIE